MPNKLLGLNGLTMENLSTLVGIRNSNYMGLNHDLVQEQTLGSQNYNIRHISTNETYQDVRELK